ncbi:MAG: glycoside hydrolase [Ferruginibacter sp.]
MLINSRPAFKSDNTFMKITANIKFTLRIFCSLLLLLAMGICGQAQQKRIYIANDDHTDYMWSADEITYRNAFVNMLDYYVRKADSTIKNGLPPDQQSRFNCDGNFWLWTYEQNKTRGELSGLIDKIKSGHISVPFNALVSCHGGTPAEAVLRGMYYAGSLERRFKLDLELAVTMENQTQPLGLASLWSGAGAKYSWKGICGCVTEFGNGKPAGRDVESYWYTGLDGKKILLKWYSLNDTVPPGGRDKNQSLGGYAEARDPYYAVAVCKKRLDAKNYDRYRVAGAFGYGWDDIQTYNSDDFIKAAKAGTNAAYRVIVSNEKDFFEDLKSTHGKSLPSLTCTFGNEWDLLCASLAETSAKVKRSLEKLRSAESMATLVAARSGAKDKTADSARIKAWMGYGLYWEHDWTADGPACTSSQRAAWQRKIESQITDYTNKLYDSSKIELGKQIGKMGSNERFFVFNSLNWKRSDYADYPYTGNEDINVTDVTTKAMVPHQAIVKNGISYLRILATDIPSVGYKVYEIRSGKGTAFTDAATVSPDNTVVENKLYKLTINKAGAITSLVDKKNNRRECIGDGRANDLGSFSDTGIILVENSGPVSVTLKAVSPAPVSHITRITIYKDLPRVDIDNQITQNFTDVRKWKYSFNLNAPETWHEEVGAVIKAKLTSNGGQYSTFNASYKYQTLNHFASINEAGYGITLSNRDCYFMQLGNSSFTRLDENSNTLNVLAGGRAAGPGIGIPNQDGDTLFNQSFALSTHTKFNKAAEMKFALEHQDPFVTGTVTGESGNYPATNYSYLAITDPDVLLWALKPAEEGYAVRGIIARVWNLGNKPGKCSMVFRRKIAGAWQASHVETDISSIPYTSSSLKTSIPAQGMNTYRLKFPPLYSLKRSFYKR